MKYGLDKEEELFLFIQIWKYRGKFLRNDQIPTMVQLGQLNNFNNIFNTLKYTEY